MKYTFKILKILIILLFLVYSVDVVSAAWADVNEPYRANVPISNGSRPYQISLNLSNSTGTNNATTIFCNGKCNPNFTDIRFYLQNTTVLPYWIENNSTGKVWVNVTANGSVQMYYGNTTYTSLSNVNTTFITVISNVSGAWDLNGNVLDSSGNNNDGTLQGGMGFTTGKFYQAGNFNATGSKYVSIGNVAALQLNFPMSITGWIKRNVVGTQSSIIGGASANDWGYYFPAADNLAFGKIAVNQVTSTSTYTNNTTIYHAVMTYDGSNVRFYINNTLDGSPVYTSTFTASAKNIGNVAGTILTGNIENLRVYNKTLNTTEISYLYSNYGYTTENYPGKELVRYFTTTEPQWSTWGTEELLYSNNYTNDQTTNFTVPIYTIIRFYYNDTLTNWAVNGVNQGVATSTFDYQITVANGVLTDIRTVGASPNIAWGVTSSQLTLLTSSASPDKIFKCGYSTISTSFTGSNVTNVFAIISSTQAVQPMIPGSGRITPETQSTNITLTYNGSYWVGTFGNNSSLLWGNRSVTYVVINNGTETFSSSSTIFVYNSAGTCTGTGQNSYQNYTSSVGNRTSMLVNSNLNLLEWGLYAWLNLFGYLFFVILVLTLTVSVAMKTQDIYSALIVSIIVLILLFASNFIPVEYVAFILFIEALIIAVTWKRIFTKSE